MMLARKSNKKDTDQPSQTDNDAERQIKRAVACLNKTSMDGYNVLKG